jgi:hypothetical protein
MPNISITSPSSPLLEDRSVVVSRSICSATSFLPLQIPAQTLKRFLELFSAAPDHPGFYPLVQWCLPMRDAIFASKSLLLNLPGGLRSYVNWLKLHQAPKVCASRVHVWAAGIACSEAKSKQVLLSPSCGAYNFVKA